MDNTKVLIVTNEKIVANNLRDCLIDLGYTVTGIAVSNQEVIAKVQESKPDLILTDISLNGVREGIKTGELIHSNFNVPLIYITGSVGQATIQRARGTGPFGYIFKPFDEKQIYATIETALIRHELEAELRKGRLWLNAVLDSIGDGVIALDNRGTIRFMNPIAEQLTGWSEFETIGKTLYEIFAFIDESTQERIEVSGSKQSVDKKNAETKIEGLLLSKNGKLTPVEADTSIISNGTGLVIVFRDITKRREAIQEVQRQSQRAEVLVETAERLNAQLKLTSVLDTVCSISNRALKAAATGVFLQDATKNIFRNMATYTQLTDFKNYDGMKFEIPDHVFGSIVSEEHPVTLISDIQSLPNLPFLELFREQNIHTMGIAGLYRQQHLIGVLISIFIGDPLQLPADTLALFKGLANQAAISIINARLFEQVQKSRERQKALTTKLVEIQEAERRHIARELHDQIGQVLTGLQFMLEASKNQAGEAGVNRINEAQDTVSGLIEQIREMSLNLRPPMLDDIGLLPTLNWHFERYTKQTGIEVLFHHHGLSQRLLPDVETAVYRIIQEALTNVARHAQVIEVSIQLTLRENVLGIEIIDRGLGFDISVYSSKWSTAGLAGMRERANMLGGYLVVNSSPNKGTRILVMLPLDRKPVERRDRDRNLSTG